MRSFKDFMQDRVREYYSQASIGQDFFTASELDKAFGIALSEHLYEFIKQMDHPVLLELGGGNGSLAYDILSFLRDKHTELYKRLTYYIYERSPYLIDIQKKRLKDFEGKVFWIKEFIPVDGVIFSNEFFDCLPVHVIRGGRELYVDGQNFLWKDVSDERILSFMKRMGYTHLEQVVEVCLECVDFLQEVSKHLRIGYHIVIDYGYTSEELYRYPEGTVVGYKSHRLVMDLLKEMQPFDMSAMVNFSALMSYGNDMGLLTLSLQNLRDFLLFSPSFLHELEKLSFSEKPDDIERLSRLKTMLISMGDRFKVLIQKKL